LISIQEIDLKKVYPVRNLVLRKGKPIESCYFVDDKKETTKHFGLVLNKKVIGVVSFFEQKNVVFKEKKQFQIRGMTVLEEFQNHGYGKLLIEKGEDYCLSLQANLIWFNARENAVPFYEKLNYIVIAQPFEIKDVGIHYIMFKKLI